MKFEWQDLTLGDVVETVIDYRGKTPKKLGGDWSNTGYRAFSAKNIKTGQIVQHESIRFVDEEMYHKWMKVEIQKGDILITSEAPFGQIFYWDSDEKIVLSQRLFGVRIKKQYDPRFVYYYMITKEFQSEMDHRATGTTVVGLRQPELMKCALRCPDYETQKKISAILTTIDKKIAVNMEINHNLLQQAQALYKAHFPYSVEYELPLGWKIGKVRDIIELHDSKRIPLSSRERDKMTEKKYPYYGATSVMDYVSDYIFDGCYLLLAEDGTVIDSNGHPILQYVWGKFWVNNHAHIITGKNGFSVESLLLYFSQLSVQSIVTGAVQPKISQANLCSVPVVIPPREAVEEFNNTISPLFTMLRSLSDENNHLAQLRDSLLPKLMSGEIDVSEVEI